MRGLSSLVVLAGATACGDQDDRLHYAWDDRAVVCSRTGDDLTADAALATLEDQMQVARELQSATLIHLHAPGANVSVERLRAILDLAASYELEFVTFAELLPGPPRAALALAFDDDAVDEWFSVRELLLERGARVTFFMTLYHTLDDERRAKLAALAGDGHDVSAHAVLHLAAPDFIAEHGLSAYLEQEVLPSIHILERDGYAPSTFAFPYGASDDEANEAVLRVSDRVRVGLGSCPH